MREKCGELPYNESVSLYIIGGRGAGGHRNIWVPGDPGTPNSADSKVELLRWSPQPERLSCANAECGNLTQVYALSRRGGYWSWCVNRFCRRCFDLRRWHGLEFPELVAIWEAQGRQCYRPECSHMLTDPRLPSEGRRAGIHKADGSWVIRIDHDHKICPQDRHSCEKCRRGLACNHCNCQPLSIKSGGSWILPEKPGDLTRWLEFLGPEGRDRLRAGLIQFPEQPARRMWGRSCGERTSGEVIPLFGFDACG